MAKKEGGYDFGDYKKDALTRPRDAAWTNWMKFEKVGDKAQGFIRDVFYKPAEGMYQAQRGITIEQIGGELINVAIKRLPFILAKTDNLHLGDPLTVVFDSELPAKTKGFNKTKIIEFYGTNLDENKGNKTVRELDETDRLAQGAKDTETLTEDVGEEEAPVEKGKDIPF